MVIIKAIIL